jgi:hypothetical protein
MPVILATGEVEEGATVKLARQKTKQLGAWPK